MLCSTKGMGGSQRFLYEVAPDIFPHGYLTEVEIALWDRYYTEKNDTTPQISKINPRKQGYGG